MDNSGTLTSRGEDVKTLQAIHTFISTNGYAPSTRDLLEPLGVTSTSVINHRLAFLMRVGWITKVPNIARTINITSIGKDVLDAAN